MVGGTKTPGWSVFLSLLQYEWGQSSGLAPSLGLNVDRRILGPTLPTVRA